MVHAPDSGRLRSLFARSFHLGQRPETHRYRITRDPLQRLEPSFDPRPQTAAPKRDPASPAQASAPIAEGPLAPPANPPHTNGPARDGTRACARYGRPGALASEVFGPYARRAEAELSVDLGNDEDDLFAPAAADTDPHIDAKHTRETDARSRPRKGEELGSLIDRLSLALAGIDPGLEKNSADFPPPAPSRGREPHANERAPHATEGVKVMKRDEMLAEKTAPEFSETDAVAITEPLHPPRP